MGGAGAILVLLQAKADPNYKDINGHIPLHHAAFDGTRLSVEHMLAFGGNKKVKGQDGMSPYQFATIAGHDEIAELRSKMDEMAEEFGEMLRETLDKMRERIEVTSGNFDAPELPIQRRMEEMKLGEND